MNLNGLTIQIICSILFLIDRQPAAANKVLELSDRFLEVSNDGTWFVMFYAPWCGHCKKLEPIWHQVSQSLHSSNIRVSKVDCTRFPSVATEYNVRGFPTILLLKNGEVFQYKGDRSREPLVDYAERMALPPLQQIVDTHTMKVIIQSTNFFLYVGENKGSLWDAFNETAYEYQPFIYFYTVSHSVLASSGVELETSDSTILVFKDKTYHIYPHKKHIVENAESLIDSAAVEFLDDGIVQLNELESLKYWINHERFPTMVEITPGNFHQVMKTNKFIVLAVLEEDKIGRLTPNMIQYKEVLEQFAHANRDVYHKDFLFGWTGSPDLPNSVAMMSLPVPSIIVINATSFHHHLPEEYIEILTPENLSEFLNRVLQNDIQAHGGTGFFARINRIYYDSTTTFKGMWYGNPVLTTVIIGLPLGFLSLICYSMWCADIMDAAEEDNSTCSQLFENRVDPPARTLVRSTSCHLSKDSLSVVGLANQGGGKRTCSLDVVLLPKIRVDDDFDAEQPVNIKRRFSVQSNVSFATTRFSDQFPVEKCNSVTVRIHELVSSFFKRANLLKEQIREPLSPSASISDRGEDAPSPPPLHLGDKLVDCPEEEATKRAGFFASFHRWRIPRTIHPQSLTYVVWLSVMAIAFVYNAWCIPLRISFPYQDESNIHVWLTLDYIMDVVYLIDTLLIRPRLRFVSQGIWVEDVPQCRQTYLNTACFKLDALSLLPLDLLYFYFGLNTPLLRVPRMIRILPFWELFDRLDVIVSSSFLIRIGRTLFYMLYLIHLNGCAYYSFSHITGIASTSFVYQGDGNAYVRCFYFAMKTATKIGKNPKPINNIERTFMIFNWLIGVFACAAIIGQIRDLITAAERNETDYREHLDRTINVMNRLNLPPLIQDRVRRWFTYSWSLQKTLDGESSLLSLPRKLQTDIALDVHIETLAKVQLFHGCERGLIQDLVLRLKPVLFLPNDLVCKKGEIGKEMYIVKSGYINVLGGADSDIVLATLKEGSVFGEISLLSVGTGNRRTADVRSKGFSNVFVLSKNDLNEVLVDYPEAEKTLTRKAKILLMKSNKREKTLTQERDAILPVIEPKLATPKLLKTVLQVVPPSSLTSRLLRYGSRLPGSNEANRTSSHNHQQTVHPIIENRF